MKWLGLIVLFVVGVAAGFLFTVTEDYYEKPFGEGSVSVVFSVSQGESFGSISRRLEQKKLIHHPKLLSFLARIYGIRGKMRAGEYSLKDNQSPEEILTILSSGRSINYPFTVTEGLNSFEIALMFEKKGYGKKESFLEACADAEALQKVLSEKVKSCEGYLFPDTYSFEKKTTAKQMIEVMMQSFLRNYEMVSSGRTLPQKWTRHQVITFASLIEKETGAPEERPLIASVFYNRLRQNIRLQTDPTVQYGVLFTTGVYPMNITRKDLTTPTPYNTYTNFGLPPGPISNPGMDAIRAVFKPAQSDFIFFVSRNDGTHVFTKTYDEHRKAVQNFQIDPKAREGKSWRNLTKEN